MPTSKHYFVSEDEIRANKRSISHAQTCWKALVVRIPQAKNCSSLRVIDSSILDMKQAEIALSITMKGMIGIFDTPTIFLDLVLHSVNQEGMTNRLPRLSLFGRLHRFNCIEVYLFCSADGEVDSITHNFFSFD
jgi:hypothetical protein